MTIKAITITEKAVREFKVTGQTVSCTHTVKADRDSEVRFNLRWVLDFAGVKPAELMELAARTIIIRKQADWRKAKDRQADRWQGLSIKVRDVLDETRATADPLTKAATQIDKMSDTEKADLLKLVQASLAKK